MVELIKKYGRPIKAALRNLYHYLRWAVASETYLCNPEEAFQKLSELAPSPGTSAVTDNHIGPKIFDLTIIVPAYNAEKWLYECVESILNQKTQFTFQVIFVDDGSKDRTPEILDSYAGDHRVVVIHQENKGHSGARNVALKQINSKYVMFVDSDDVLLPGAIEKLLREAFTQDADIVEGNGYRFDQNGRLGHVKHQASKQIWGGPWLKVIRSELLKHLHFPDGYLYEDTIISTLLVPIAKKVVTIPDEVYGWRIHPASITQNHTAELNRVHSFWIMLQVHEDMKKLGLEKDYESYRRTMHHIVFTYRRCILLPEHIKKLIFVCTDSFVRDNYGEYLNTRDEYYKLARALQDGQYGKYIVFCETIEW